MPARLPSQIARRDARRRLGVAQDVRELALSVEHIDRHDDQAELGPREPEIDHLDPILQKECDAITGLGSARSEQVREPIAAVFQITKGKRTPPSVPAHKLQGRPRGAGNQRKVKEGQEGHQRGFSQQTGDFEHDYSAVL